MEIAHFDDLLGAARRQPEPQRLLFVFTVAELPEGSSAEQAARFDAGQGGALVPLMCVDKTPEEVVSFAALAQESRRFGPAWALVFVAAMADGRDTAAPLQRMVDDIRRGALRDYLPFNTEGEAVRLA